jgi:poly(hydroxyalkanoate) depolymerase family esterase
MAGALRLTRQGRLKEALAVLQGKPADLTNPATEKPRQFGNAGVLQFLDAAVLGNGSQLEPGQFLKTALAPVADNVSRPPLQQSRFEAHSFANEAGVRKYKLFVPSGHRGQKLPLVVMLHGCTQSPDDFAAGTRMNDLAEAQEFLVAYPEQARSANIGKCWNWFNTDNQSRDQGEASLIAGITRQIMLDFAVQPGRVYIAGLSAGGALAAIMGSAYPELYAAIGVHSGLACGAASDLPSAVNAMRHGAAAPAALRSNGSARVTPAIVFHGDRDTTVNIANAGQIIAQSRGAAQLQPSVTEGEAGGMQYTRAVYSEGKRPLLEEWVLHGAGHAWSGGSAAGSYTNPQGPDASSEMIRFFFQQPAAA